MSGEYLVTVSVFFQAEDGIRDLTVTGVQTCALPILEAFEDGADALAETDAHGRHTEGAAILLHHVQQGTGDTRTGTTERVTQGDRAAVQVDLLFNLVEHFQVLQHRQGLGSEGFVKLEEVDVVDGQTSTLEGFLSRGYWTVTHDRWINAGHGHGANHGHWLNAEVLSALSAHDDHAGSAVSDLRGRTCSHGAAFGVERRLQRSQACQGGFRTNGFVVVEHLQEAVLVVALHRDDFILELAFDGSLVGQTVRTLTECVLLLTADAMHLAE